MSGISYTPTAEQKAVIDHVGSAFVTACPGAGKTRTMVERMRRLLEHPTDHRAIALLSFTNTAVRELECRLHAHGVLPSPLFPSFIGTFDRFLWIFLVAPFGIDGFTSPLSLIPDKSDWEIKPFEGAQALLLSHFDRRTGKAITDLVKRAGFDTATRDIRAHETCALSTIQRSKQAGIVDFEDIRTGIKARLANTEFSNKLGAALSARFREIIVDEAQDCNPEDLSIVDWLEASGIAVKVICDPNQAIFGFRGGVTQELDKYASKFSVANRLHMCGNFRSSPAICAAIVALRPPTSRDNPDKALGQFKIDQTPVHIISYSGSAVPESIGPTFRQLAESLGIPMCDARVLAATKASASNAIGQPVIKRTTHPTLLLAEAVVNYEFCFAMGDRLKALAELHRVVLLIKGHIESLGAYHTYLGVEGLQDEQWRPELISLADSLRFKPSDTPEQWLERARGLLSVGMVGDKTIKRRLRFDKNLKSALAAAPSNLPHAATIHSVKGLEFAAVCVVLTTNTAGQIMKFLEGVDSEGADEEARKIYVAASRAQRLLVFAVPKSRSARLKALLIKQGCTPSVMHI